MSFIPRGEIEERIRRLKTKMEKASIDGAFFHYKVDYFYLTGTMQDGILYVPLDGDPLFFVRREPRRAERESAVTCLPYATIFELNLKNIERVGLELDIVPYNDVIKFKKIIGERKILDISPIIKDLRRKKSDFEIGLMEKAASIAKKVYEKAKEIIKEGMKEIELGGILHAYAMGLGHEGLLRFRTINYEPYSWHILSGKTGSVVGYADSPMGGFGLSATFPVGASKKKIKKGEPILIDFGICYKGYHLDSTRMFALAFVPDIYLKAYAVCREIEERIMEGLSNGKMGKELFKLSIDIAKEKGFDRVFLGYEPYKVKFIGHGIGLELSEPPFVAENSDYGFGEGEVLAIEPKMVFPKMGACGIEDTILVKKDGCKFLSQMEREFIIL